MAKKKGERWVIEFKSVDPSRDIKVAYDNRAKAVEAALDFIKDAAKSELKDIEWQEGDDAPEMLNEVLDAIKDQDADEAIIGWLRYQQEYNPEEGIAIGPSGSVSDSPWDFPEEK